MPGFFQFGCRFGAVAGWGMILRLGPARLGLWEDVWEGSKSRDYGDSRTWCVGIFETVVINIILQVQSVA